MASYKKYAENLIGNWEKDIYAPQQQIAQDVYKTNWNQLTNNFNTLKDQLARNFENARTDYANTLADVQDTSFNRVNAAYNDLANRGLSASGMVNDIVRADTALKGQEIDRALSSLMKATEENVSGLTEGVNKYGSSQTKLASDLAGDLGKLTDADAANNQQYAGLVGSLAESAASRAANNAISRMSRASDNDEDELTRRMAIADLLRSDEYTDDEKISMMTIYGDVPVEQARSAVSAYNYDTASDRYNNLLNNYSKSTINKFVNATENNRLANLGLSLVSPLLSTSPYNIFSIPRSFKNSRADKINTARENLSKYTYGDIYNILYGNK